MFDIFANHIHREAIRAMLREHDEDAQNRVYQSIYDAGASGPAIAKALQVKDIYERIDAHRGRGPARRPKDED